MKYLAVTLSFALGACVAHDPNGGAAPVTHPDSRAAPPVVFVMPLGGGYDWVFWPNGDMTTVVTYSDE